LKNLGVLATNLYAIATSNAPVGQNLGLTVVYFNGLGRALSYTGIANPAEFLNGIN